MGARNSSGSRGAPTALHYRYVAVRARRGLGTPEGICPSAVAGETWHSDSIVLALPAKMLASSPRQRKVKDPFAEGLPAEKRSLASILREHGPMAVTEAVDLALDICDALASAHANGVVHGDLGLHRVRTTWPRAVGASIDIFALGENDSAAFAFRSSVSGLLVAPEQRFGGRGARAPSTCPGARVDLRADIWAVGAMLYAMIAGTPPASSPAPLARVPRALAACIEACLAEDPARRPDSVDAVAEAIGSFASAPAKHFERLARRRAERERAGRARTDLAEVDRVLCRLDDAALEREVLAATIPPAAALDRLAIEVLRSAGQAGEGELSDLVDDEMNIETVLADRPVELDPVESQRASPAIAPAVTASTVAPATVWPAASMPPAHASPAPSPARSRPWSIALGGVAAAAALVLGIVIGVRLVQRVAAPVVASAPPAVTDIAPPRSRGADAPLAAAATANFAAPATSPAVITPASLPDAPSPARPTGDARPTSKAGKASPPLVEIASPSLLTDALR